MKKYKLKINGNAYHVQVLEADRNKIQLEVNGTEYEVELETEVKQTKTPTLVRAEPSQVQRVEPLKTDKSVKKIIAPLPGIILGIAVEVGSKVKIGDSLLVLEAMKMENTIIAESSGTVKAILVKPQSTVLQGDTLLEIE